MIKLHRVIGLTLGVWLTWVGLSGTFLVFHEELDDALHRSMMLGDVHHACAASAPMGPNWGGE